MKNNITDIDMSEYAGYGGLIVANGGLAPNPESIFAKQYGFQVRLTLSEEEGWSKLNNGRIAASVTTVSVESWYISGPPPSSVVVWRRPPAATVTDTSTGPPPGKPAPAKAPAAGG